MTSDSPAKSWEPSDRDQERSRSSEPHTIPGLTYLDQKSRAKMGVSILRETPCHFALFPRPLAQHRTYIEPAEDSRKACYQVFAASAAFAEVTPCLPQCWNQQWQHIKKQLDSPCSNKPSLTALLIFLWGGGLLRQFLYSPVCRPGCPRS